MSSFFRALAWLSFAIMLLGTIFLFSAWLLDTSEYRNLVFLPLVPLLGVGGAVQLGAGLASRALDHAHPATDLVPVAVGAVSLGLSLVLGLLLAL